MHFASALRTVQCTTTSTWKMYRGPPTQCRFCEGRQWAIAVATIQIAVTARTTTLKFSSGFGWASKFDLGVRFCNSLCGVTQTLD